MGNDARKYTALTIRKLDILSGNQCAAPDCNNVLSESYSDEDLRPFDISDKIQYNNIRRNKYLIEEYRCKILEKPI